MAVVVLEFPEPPPPLSAEAIMPTAMKAPIPVRILCRANQERFGSGAGMPMPAAGAGKGAAGTPVGTPAGEEGTGLTGLVMMGPSRCGR